MSDQARDYDRFAGVYDVWYPDRFFPDRESAVDVLAGLAGSGPALELGIGTGRVALPLAARGVEVHGIDISEAMVAQLRAKPGGDAIPVTIGDFSDVAVAGRFPLIFVIFNTLSALLTQEDQVRCFANAAAHLTDDGVFVVEAFGPQFPAGFREGQRVQAGLVDRDIAILDMGNYDPIEQQASVQYVVLTPGKLEMFGARSRYASPAELDLMARMAGLRLRHRWGGWQGDPMTAEHNLHVSVYERARREAGGGQ